MTACREVSSAVVAARTATVLPAPTSPVITPRACWSMHQAMRATASACPSWRCSMDGARLRPTGSGGSPSVIAGAERSPADLLPLLGGAVFVGAVVDRGLPGDLPGLSRVQGVEA